MSEPATDAITESDLPPNLQQLWKKSIAAIDAKNYQYAIAITLSILQQEPGFLTGRRYLRSASAKAKETQKKGLKLGSGSLGRYDKQISAPTVVIHGRADTLMRPAGGRAIAAAIPRARLVLFDGMGHDLPEPLFDAIIGELDTTFAQFAQAR